MDLKQLQSTPPWEWPEKAGKIFLAVLKDDKASLEDRMIAAELGGNLVAVNDDLADALLAIAGNAAEPDTLRALAAISLGPVLDSADTDGFEDGLEMVPISEQMFEKIKTALHKLYLDQSVPKEVRRRVLEASMRASADWHDEAIKQAYTSGDRDWKLTAVFGMRWVAGFEAQILEALESDDDEIHYEAVEAAGNCELDAAWPHIEALVKSPSTDKHLLLAAIEAVGSIRPAEAEKVLRKLTKSKDREVAEAASEAIEMAEMASDFDDEDDDETEIRKWVN